MGEAGSGLSGWSALHGGVRPSAVVRGWLRGVQRVAAVPAVSRVSPDAISATGVLVAAGALGAALAGGAWALLAALLVVLTGVLDGLDGAVALHTGRARPLGAVVDAVADRLGDLLLAGVLAALGAPLPATLAAVALVFLHEYLRARAQAAGMPGVGAVTVAERPTRIVLVAVAGLGAGTLPAGTPFTGWDWATVSAVAWVAVGAVGLAHLATGVVRTVPGRTSGPASGPIPSGPTTSGPSTSGRADQVGDDPRRQDHQG